MVVIILEQLEILLGLCWAPPSYARTVCFAAAAILPRQVLPFCFPVLERARPPELRLWFPACCISGSVKKLVGRGFWHASVGRISGAG